MAWPSQTNPGLFISTTFGVDVSRLQEIDVSSGEFKELLVRLYQDLNKMALALNLKDSGYYALQEFVNGQVYPPNAQAIAGNAPNPNRQVFRTLVEFGALPNAGSKSVAHGIDITTSFIFTRIYGAASDKTGRNYLPLPYASPTLNQNISLSVDATNVTVVTGINRTAYTDTWIVLEYIKY